MPRAPPSCSRKTTHRRHTHEYTAYVYIYIYSWYLVLAMYIILCVYLEACDCTELSLPLRVGLRIGTDTDWVCLTVVLA